MTFISKPVNPRGSTLDNIDAYSVASRDIPMYFNPYVVGYNQTLNSNQQGYNSNTSNVNHNTPPIPSAFLISNLTTPSTRSALFPPYTTGYSQNQSQNYVPPAPRIGYQSHLSSSNSYDQTNYYDVKKNYKNSGNDENGGINYSLSSILFRHEVNLRTDWVKQALNERIYKLGKGFSCEEVVLSKQGNIKAKLDFNFIDTKYKTSKCKIESIYVKYHEKGKRKFY